MDPVLEVKEEIDLNNLKFAPFKKLKFIHDVEEDNKIGSGSTAAAIRLEKMTGNPLYGKMHFKKGNESIIRLEKWLKQNPAASVGDRAAADNIIKDLQNSLK